MHKGEIKNENGRIVNKKRRRGGIAIFLDWFWRQPFSSQHMSYNGVIYVDNINNDTTDTRSFFRSVYEGIIILIFNWVFIEISMIWK